MSNLFAMMQITYVGTYMNMEFWRLIFSEQIIVRI